jgi:hypothetical protein
MQHRPRTQRPQMPRVGRCGGAGSEAKGGGRYHHPVPVQEPNRLPLQPHLADGARQDRTPEESHTAAGGQPQTSDPRSTSTRAWPDPSRGTSERVAAVGRRRGLRPRRLERRRLSRAGQLPRRSGRRSGSPAPCRRSGVRRGGGCQASSFEKRSTVRYRPAVGLPGTAQCRDRHPSVVNGGGNELSRGLGSCPGSG